MDGPIKAETMENVMNKFRERYASDKGYFRKVFMDDGNTAFFLINLGEGCGSDPDTAAKTVESVSEDAPLVPAGMEGVYAVWFNDDEYINLGREGCTIAIPTGYISRSHAKFTREGERLLLSDPGSKNGTFKKRLGDRDWSKVTAPERLFDRDKLRLGSEKGYTILVYRDAEGMWSRLKVYGKLSSDDTINGLRRDPGL
ncbi:MAG: FHA domain-containing protein [Candidatus Aenigmarchaeota archaeon]